MATDIIWISRHPLSMENIEILRKAFGDDIRIRQVMKTLTEEEIAELVDYNGTKTKYVVVLPPQLIQALLKNGAEVYRFIVERQMDETGHVTIKPVGLEQVKEIKYVTERVV